MLIMTDGRMGGANTVFTVHTRLHHIAADLAPPMRCGCCRAATEPPTPRDPAEPSHRVSEISSETRDRLEHRLQNGDPAGPAVSSSAERVY